jgi:hypothetical protein
MNTDAIEVTFLQRFCVAMDAYVTICDKIGVKNPKSYPF